VAALKRQASVALSAPEAARLEQAAVLQLLAQQAQALLQRVLPPRILQNVCQMP
jgi:hypothetical protein